VQGNIGLSMYLYGWRGYLLSAPISHKPHIRNSKKKFCTFRALAVAGFYPAAFWYVMYFRFCGWRHVCTLHTMSRHRRRDVKGYRPICSKSLARWQHEFVTANRQLFFGRLPQRLRRRFAI